MLRAFIGSFEQYFPTHPANQGPHSVQCLGLWSSFMPVKNGIGPMEYVAQTF